MALIRSGHVRSISGLRPRMRSVLSRWPAAFAGTDLDPDANRKRMESLVQRMEELARSVAGPLAAGCRRIVCRRPSGWRRC